MTTLPLVSLSVSLAASPLRARLSSPQTHLSNLMFSSITTLNSKGHGQRVVANSSDRNESPFLDEDGVVDDMDGYLNHLSLEYDSVWDTKPSWCQPWTIGLTGVSAIASSWLVLHSLVITTLVSVLICAWWYIFLYSYPKAYEGMIAERRKKVTNGVEDTFGLSKSR